MGQGGRRRRLCPVPDDFAAVAWRRNTEIMDLYGVGKSTVVKWRNKTGLYAERGRRRAQKRAQLGAVDTAAQIRVCLTCTSMDCSFGDCARRRAAG